MSARKDMSIFQAILMSDDVRLASLARGTARSNLIRLERSEPGGTPSVGGRCYCGVGGIFKIPAAAAAVHRYRPPPRLPSLSAAAPPGSSP